MLRRVELDDHASARTERLRVVFEQASLSTLDISDQRVLINAVITNSSSLSVTLRTATACAPGRAFILDHRWFVGWTWNSTRSPAP